MSPLVLPSTPWIQTLPAITMENKTPLVALLWSNDSAAIKALVLRENGTALDNLKILELALVVWVRSATKALVPVLLDNPRALREALQASNDWDIRWLSELIKEFRKKNPEVQLWEWLFDERWVSPTAVQVVPDGMKSMNDLGDVHEDSAWWTRIILSQDDEELMNHIDELYPALARSIRSSMRNWRSGIETWRAKHSPKTAHDQRAITGDSATKVLDNKWPQESDYV